MKRDPSRKSGYVYGRHPVLELLRQRPRDVKRLYVADAGRSTRMSDVVGLAERHGIPLVNLARHALDDLVGGAPHQGVAAQVEAFGYADVQDLIAKAQAAGEAPLLVALDQIQDPHNLGAIMRSAAALGAHGVIILKDRAVEVTPAVVKASAGAAAHVAVAQVTNMTRCLEELKQAGLWVIGTVSTGGQLVSEVDLIQGVVIVVGSEGSGMRRLVTDTCDVLAHIPIRGAMNSLNASVAAGIVLYEAARQRMVASPEG